MPINKKQSPPKPTKEESKQAVRSQAPLRQSPVATPQATPQRKFRTMQSAGFDSHDEERNWISAGELFDGGEAIAGEMSQPFILLHATSYHSAQWKSDLVVFKLQLTDGDETVYHLSLKADETRMGFVEAFKSSNEPFKLFFVALAGNQPKPYLAIRDASTQNEIPF